MPPLLSLTQSGHSVFAGLAEEVGARIVSADFQSQINYGAI
jgi:hypothetical protein